ncbi:MAG: RimK/LysX family protein [Gammaproteobacteria bacterium]
MKTSELPIIGWREWLALPELGIDKLRCKVDTGAKTSALHAFYVEPFEKDGTPMVRFGLHPDEKSTDIEQHCEAAILDQRSVTDSGGHVEQRYVIQTRIVLGYESWPIQITLTNRDTMKHRMLLGRAAIMDNFLVDSGAQHLMGKPAPIPKARSLLSRLHDEEE